MKIRAAQATTIVLFALVMGVFWGTWFSLSRTMSQLSPDTFLAVGHQMINNLGGPMAILLPLSLLSGLVTLVLLRQARHRAAFWWLLAGFLLDGRRTGHHPGRRGPDRQPDPDLDSDDPAGRLALDPDALGAVPHRSPHLRLHRRPGRGHDQRHGDGAASPVARNQVGAVVVLRCLTGSVRAAVVEQHGPRTGGRDQASGERGEQDRREQVGDPDAGQAEQPQADGDRPRSRAASTVPSPGIAATTAEVMTGSAGGSRPRSGPPWRRRAGGAGHRVRGGRTSSCRSRTGPATRWIDSMAKPGPQELLAGDGTAQQVKSLSPAAVLACSSVRATPVNEGADPALGHPAARRGRERTPAARSLPVGATRPTTAARRVGVPAAEQRPSAGATAGTDSRSARSRRRPTWSSCKSFAHRYVGLLRCGHEPVQGHAEGEEHLADRDLLWRLP